MHDIAVVTGWKPLLDAKATGANAQAFRKAHGVTGRRVAREIGLCSSLICEMENGTRGWTLEKVEAYRQAVLRLKRLGFKNSE
jgi:transcriptional regulator with XRE-family HTH domain